MRDSIEVHMEAAGVLTTVYAEYEWHLNRITLYEVTGGSGEPVELSFAEDHKLRSAIHAKHLQQEVA